MKCLFAFADTLLKHREAVGNGGIPDAVGAVGRCELVAEVALIGQPVH